MAIGRTFQESLQKALRGLEVGRFGLGCDKKDLWYTPRQPTEDEIKAKLAIPNAERVWAIRYGLLAGLGVEGDAHALVVELVSGPGADVDGFLRTQAPEQRLFGCVSILHFDGSDTRHRPTVAGHDVTLPLLHIAQNLRKLSVCVGG